MIDNFYNFQDVLQRIFNSQYDIQEQAFLEGFIKINLAEVQYPKIQIHEQKTTEIGLLSLISSQFKNLLPLELNLPQRPQKAKLSTIYNLNQTTNINTPDLLVLNNIILMERKRTVQVLFLGSIERTEEVNSQEKPADQIDFGRPVRVTLIRIPKFKRDLYGKLISITQSQPIKNFQIFFRNLEETLGRYSLVVSNNEIMATSTSDILITPAKPFITDMLVIRGIFLKLSLCIYGDLVEQVETKLWKSNVNVAESAPMVQIKRNIFEEKRQCINIITREIQKWGRSGYNWSMVDSWQQANDDEINEPQIKNICNISQHLLNTFQQINDDTYIVKFREHIENINNMLQKLYKSKQIGLYYNKQQNYALQNEIPLPLVHIGLSSLKLSISDQFRVLQMLKMLAQLPRHATAIIQGGGVGQLTSLFLEFYKPNAVFFSTFKNVVIEVCIALSQWQTAAQRMVTKLEQNILDQIYEFQQKKGNQRDNVDKKEPTNKENQREKIKDNDKSKAKRKSKEKEKARSISRSRDKTKTKKSRSISQSDSNSDDKSKRKKDKNKKDKKDKRKKEKLKKKDRSKERQEKKQKEKQKEKKKDKQKDKDKDKEKQKQKHKEREKQKMKQELQESQSPMEEEQNTQSRRESNNLSFYELLFFVLLKQKNSKTLSLIKILIEQITQTLTKNKEVSQQIALMTSFLRDTKYLFNQGTQIINSKSLKVFATFQPFLNEYQSQNVDCKYIAERQKLKNPIKYGINPKTYKILSKINQEIVAHSTRQYYGFGTPYDQNFMVMLSQLIFQKEKPILNSFSKIVSSFKADGLMLLQRHQAAISIIAEYIYKALLDDQGFNTLLYLDHIHSSLIKFISYLNEDPSLFSTQLKGRIKLLSNYATPYDHFSRAEGVFKAFCQYFLKLFKYENYEIQINNKAKLTDFRKKQYQKLTNPFLFDNLMQNYALKNFNEVSSSQPLLEIDACLKIFLVLCQYNKNIWTTFYQNKLISGFSSLLNKVSSLVLFFLSQSPNRWTSYANSKNYLNTIDNYLTVVKHILMLMAKKCRYESAYNDLLQQDIFEDVELFQKCIEIYICLHNAYHDKSILIYTNKSLNKIKCIMSLIIQIIDHFLTSYEIISHGSRQSKLKKLLQHLYVKHYSEISSRTAIISIIAQLVKLSEGATAKYFLVHLLDNHFTLSKLFENQTAYIPINDKCIIQNIIKTNIFRSSLLITNNLGFLLKNLFNKPIFFDKTLDIVDRIFQEIDDLTKKNEDQLGQISWVSLRKAHLFSELLVKMEVSFKSRLDDKMLRFLKRILDNNRKKMAINELKSSADMQNFIIFLKTKNNFMTYFGRLIKQNTQNTITLNYFQFTSKVLNFQSYIDPQHQLRNNALFKEINKEIFRSCRIYIQSLAQIGLNPYYQCLLLYGQVMQKPYKPHTFLNFSQTLVFVEKVLPQYLIQDKNEEKNEILQITASIIYFLGTLTTINNQDLFTTQSRRLAITYLVSPSQKDFPFKPLKSLKVIGYIPKELIAILQQYFNYPIVEKPIMIPQKIEVKVASKPKSTIYSKSVFNMISEHDPVSKTRFRYIGGEWVGGDVQKALYTPFRNRNYEEQLEKSLMVNTECSYSRYHFRTIQTNKENTVFNELFYLSLKKQKQEMQKKQIQRTIQLKDVIARFTPQQIKKEIIRPSPPPSASERLSQNMTVPSNQAPAQLSHIKSTGSAQKSYNRSGSNQRSGSHGPSPMPQSYQTQQNYYNSRAPPGPSGPPPPMAQNPGYNPHMQHQHGYSHQPPQQPYNPYYGNPPPNAYRYPPYGGPPPPHMYMNPAQMNKPPYYPPNMGGPMYGDMMLNQLDMYQAQLFNEGLDLISQIRSSSFSEAEVVVKKNRLNEILSSSPKVHNKLKESLKP